MQAFYAHGASELRHQPHRCGGVQDSTGVRLEVQEELKNDKRNHVTCNDFALVVALL